MTGLDNLEILFVVWAFLFQLALILHFALRRWSFGLIRRYGWLLYALSAPAVIVSVLLLLGGKTWSLWLGGFLYLVWAIFGYTVEYVRGIRWRNPIHWPVFGPYVTLYLATIMFYWWPLGLLSRPLWYVYALLFVASTVLNVASHRGPQGRRHPV
jgi:hypothetical protein